MENKTSWEKPKLIKVKKAQPTENVLDGCRDPDGSIFGPENTHYPWKCRKLIDPRMQEGQDFGSCDWCQS